MIHCKVNTKAFKGTFKDATYAMPTENATCWYDEPMLHEPIFECAERNVFLIRVDYNITLCNEKGGGALSSGKLIMWGLTMRKTTFGGESLFP